MTAAFVVDRPGPLAFPVTPFQRNGSLDLDAFERHVDRLMQHEPAALFVACGTGEFAALDVAEVEALVGVAVGLAGSRVPVYSGVGGGIALAKSFARVAELAGARGLLVLPPYLADSEQEGLEEYYRELAAGTSLGLILYQRGLAIFEPDTVHRLCEVENIVGFKDGLGDIERMTRIVKTVERPITYFNGMPTAETYQAAYAAIGVEHYSSAVFNFVPEVAWAFFRAQADGDGATMDAILKAFFVPFAELRRKVRGYAVALVKEGVRIRFGEVGPVRPPLVEVRREHVRSLETIMDAGLRTVQRRATP